MAYVDNPEFLKWLEIQRQVESGGDKQAIHRTMDSGLHKGTRAVGDLGLMPISAQTQAKRLKRDGKLKVEFKPLLNSDPAKAQEYLIQHPEVADQISEELAREVYFNRAQGDPEKAAYKWNQGENTTPTKEDIDNSRYIRKFRLIRDMMDNSSKK